MHKSVQAISLALVLIGHATLIGQENQALLRDFGTRMTGGTWHRKKPAEQPDKHSYNWILGNRFVTAQFENANEPSSFAVVGIDPRNGTLTWWGFDSDGNVAAFPFRTENLGGQRYEFTGIVEDRTRRSVHTFPDEDRIEVETTLDGQNQPVDIWERSQDLADLSWLFSEVPQPIPSGLNQVGNFSGEKWVSGTNSIGKMIGVTDGSWILDGKFFLYSAAGISINHSISSHIVVFGIEPETNAAKGWGFADDGSVSTFSLSEDGESLEATISLSPTESISFQGRFEQLGEFVRLKGTSNEKPVSYDYHDVKL